jgi:hypothetical protein
MVGVNGLVRHAACVVFIAQTSLLGDGLLPTGASTGHKKGAANAAPPSICLNTLLHTLSKTIGQGL